MAQCIASADGWTDGADGVVGGCTRVENGVRKSLSSSKDGRKGIVHPEPRRDLFLVEGQDAISEFSKCRAVFGERVDAQQSTP